MKSLLIDSANKTVCMAYKKYLTELFYTNACPKINHKYFNSLHTDDSIFKLQLCLTPGVACWSGWYRCLNDKKKQQQTNRKTMRKGIFKVGSEQRCHRLGSEKKAFSWKMVSFRHTPDINSVIGENTNM